MPTLARILAVPSVLVLVACPDDDTATGGGTTIVTTDTGADATTTTAGTGVDTSVDATGGGLACPDNDAFEPNDTQASATIVADGDVIDAVLCPGESDWYRVILSGTSYVGVDAMFDNSIADLRLELHTPTGLDWTSNGDKNIEVIHRRVGTVPGGAVHVHVDATSSIGSAPYRIRFMALLEG